MLKSFLARFSSGRPAANLTATVGQSTGSTTYRLVGYATTPEGQRLRVFIDDGPASLASQIAVQATPGRFDYYRGQLLGLRSASLELARSVRTYLLNPPALTSLQGGAFQPAI